MSIPPYLWSFTERHQRFFKAKECMATGAHSPCGGRLVRAHIIPRLQLRQIARSGHVVAVPTSLIALTRMRQTRLEVERFGVGEYSTLNCFCADHDKTLFAPIEDASLTFSPEQIALLHYRALAAQFYQCSRRAESAASELNFESDAPRNSGFSWIFTWSDKAFDEPRHALIRTERSISARRFEDVRSQ
jgi:hypothetical protein